MTWLRVLGGLEIRAGSPSPDDATSDEAVPISSRRLRRLLAALVIRANSAASTDWLAEAVWADDPPQNADGSLQTLVSRLRSHLREANTHGQGDAIEVVTEPAGYRLVLTLAQLDTARFEGLVRRGRDLARTRPDQAIRSLDDALAWWRGAPYAELAEEDFTRPDATRLEQLHAEVVLDRLALLLESGQHHEAAATLEGLVAGNPLDERATSLLMLARYRDARQQSALELYADFRRRLADELGLEPSETVQHLHNQILRHDPELRPATEPLHDPSASPPAALETASAPGAAGVPEAPPTAATAHPSAPERGNLPGVIRRLVGRDSETILAEETLSPGALLTLTGPGGVGKTSLARVVGERLRDRYTDGVWFCDLAAVTEPEALANAIRTTLGAPPRQGTSVTERLVDFLRAREAMLILDNCEHVVAAAAELVEAIHRDCPDVSILATSRMPLEVTDEVVRTLTTLATPRLGELDISAIAEQPSVELFVRRAQSQNPDFTLDADSAGDVAEICRRLDGLPLALELAASRMRTMSPADLVDRLSWRFRLLHGGARTADDRHRTLRALVDWSYELLEANERDVFESLSVFAGAFTLDDAEELIERIEGLHTRPSPGGKSHEIDADVSGRVLDLVDRSMISQTRGVERRYQLLETIRAYGREKLSDRGNAEAVARAHAELFTDLAEGAVTHLFGPMHMPLVEELASHIDELRAAFTWAVENDLGLAVRLVAGMPPYVESRMSAEVAHWAGRVLEVSEEQGRRPPALARVYAVAASGSRFAGALDEARRLLDRGSALARDDMSKAYVLYLSSEVALFEGRFSDAWETLAEGRRLAEENDDVAGMRDFGNILGALLLAYDGRTDEAALAADRCRAEGDAADNGVMRAWATYTQGEVRLDVDPERAMAYLDDALELARSWEDRYLTGVVLVSAASVRGRHGDPAVALGLFRDVVLHWYSSGNWLHQWTTLRNLVDLFVRLGHDREAATLIGAIEARSTIERFGEEAQRFDAASRVVVERLDPAVRASLAEAGAAMLDDEVVAFVLTTLAPFGGTRGGEALRRTTQPE